MDVRDTKDTTSTLKKIYEEMKNRNTNILKVNKLKPDTTLKDKSPDKRICLSIFSPIKSIYFKDSYLPELYKDLEEIEGIMCNYYPDNKYPLKGNLHFTILKILGFYYVDEWVLKYKVENMLDNKDKNKIVNILRDLIPLRIEYRGVILTPSGLVICGYPNKDVNKAREKLREIFSDIIQEPYHNDVFYSTISRFKDYNDKDFSKIKELSEKYSDKYLGYVEIENFTIGLGTVKLNDYETTVFLNVE